MCGTHQAHMRFDGSSSSSRGVLSYADRRKQDLLDCNTVADRAAGSAGNTAKSACAAVL